MWSVEDGLPSNDIQALAEDPRGVLWIGSARGLAHFDGAEFVTITNCEGLVGSDVHALAIDNAANVWAGTMWGGLVRWSAGKGKRFTKRDGLPSNNIRALLADGENALWIGTTAACAGAMVKCFLPLAKARVCQLTRSPEWWTTSWAIYGWPQAAAFCGYRARSFWRLQMASKLC